MAPKIMIVNIFKNLLLSSTATGGGRLMLTILAWTNHLTIVPAQSRWEESGSCVSCAKPPSLYLVVS